MATQYTERKNELLSQLPKELAEFVEEDATEHNFVDCFGDFLDYAHHFAPFRPRLQASTMRWLHQTSITTADTVAIDSVFVL